MAPIQTSSPILTGFATVMMCLRSSGGKLCPGVTMQTFGAIIT